MYFIDYAITVVPFFSPLYSPPPWPPLPPAFPHLNSCPWVVHIRSLASPFPILFLTSPCLVCTYHFCFSFPVTFPPFYPLPFPTDNPPCDLHFCHFLYTILMFYTHCALQSNLYIVILPITRI